MIRRHLLRCLVVTSAALTVALSAAVGPASATTPASIDTTYGSNGVAVVAGAVIGVTTVDSVGRALVFGPTSGAGTGGRITRLTVDGQVDNTFGASGTLALPSSVIYTRLAIGPGGLIYILGSNAASGAASTQFVVTRLTADGGPDSGFGTGGTATVTLPAGVPPFISNAFAVRNDGDVVVSLATADTNKRGYLAALTPAGVLDTAFGPAGSTGLFQLPDKTFVFKLTAAQAPAAPVFTASTPPTSATKGVAYSYTFAATGRPAPAFSVTPMSGSLPPGLTLDPVTGVLSGTPTTVGDFTFGVTASNGVGSDAKTAPITIHVFPTPTAPVFTADSPPTTAKVGTAYSYTFAATGNPAPTFAVASGSLPTGLSLNGTTGLLSGTPTAGGAFTFTVKASNGVSPDAPGASITITVAAAPALTADTPPTTANIGSAYSYTFAATGNPAPTFSVSSGALPTGLSLNATSGLLSGVPTATGPFTFTVKAANGVTPDALSPSITITVFQAPVAPSFTADNPPGGKVGVPYSYTFRANGNPPPRFTATGTVPAGLTLNPTTGVLSGTPTAARTYYFRVKAANGVSPDAYSPLIFFTVSPAGAAAQSVGGSPAATRAAPKAAMTATAAPFDPNNDVVALLADDTASPRTYAVQRYHSDGSLDSTFGTGGTSALFPAGVVPAFVAEATDSSYYITGNDGQSVFLAHVLPNGHFDAAFGTGGILAGPVESCKPTGGLLTLAGANIYLLAIDADSSSTCGPSPAILMRFHNGALDATFGAGGEVRIDSVASMRVTGPNGGGLQPSGQMLVGLDGAAAPASASAAVTRVNTTAAGPTIAAYTQLVDDSHFGAATVAPNPAGTYLGPVAAAADAAKVTHVYAEGANHHLYEFKQTASGWSAATDLTAAVTGGPTISSPPKAFFDGTFIDVFALGATGDLIQYRNNGALGAWTATDINTAAGSGSPHVTSTIDPHFLNGVLHLYGVSTAGHLFEVDNDNASGHTWNFYDVTASAGGGTAIAGGPAALLIGTTPHVYARAAANNHLVEYVADHVGGHVWNAYDTTNQAPAAPAIAGNPIPVLIGTTPHIYAAAATNGDLIEYVADGLNGSVWNAYDQTSGSGAPKPVGNPSVVTIDGAPYGIGVPIPEVWETSTVNNDLITVVADHRANHTWNVYDVTALSGGPQVNGDPTVIVNNGTVQVFALGRAAGGAAAAVASTAGLTTGPSTSAASHFLPQLFR